MRISRMVAVALAAAAAAVPAATAAQPTVTITQFDRTRTISASPDTCPFDILVHSVGTLRDTVHSNGRDVTHAIDFKIVWSNPASGRSLTSVLGGPVIIEPNGDGTVTVTVSGNDASFSAPGFGLVFANVGHLVYIADADDPGTPLQIVKSTGHQDPSLFPAVCAPLA